MVDNLWPADAVAGAPSYSGRKLRQAQGAFLAGATSARPLGARSGVRPGTPSTTVTATSALWTCQPFGGVADVMTAGEAGPYAFAFDAVDTGAVTAAHATLPRVDIVYVAVEDPAEGIGTVPLVERRYLAGTAAASPVAPSIPVGERGFVIANLNVPASGGGSPTVTWVAPYAAAAGAPIPFNTKAQMDAVTLPAGVYADVFADSTAANNGLYRSTGSAWRSVGILTMAAGTVSLPTLSFVTVNFPAGRFATTPVVVASISSGDSLAFGETCRITSRTTSGFQIAPSEGGYLWSWIAMEVG